MKNIFINILFFIMVFSCIGCEKEKPIESTDAIDWEVKIEGIIVDLDPLCGNHCVGLFLEIEIEKGVFSSLWIWQKDMTSSSWPERGDIVRFFCKKIEGREKYKWDKLEPSSSFKEKTLVETSSLKEQTPIKTSSSMLSEWTSVVLSLPPIGETVLVKYKNGKTITTAYLNRNKQWKLETDRDNIAGGREIDTIDMWRYFND